MKKNYFVVILFFSFITNLNAQEGKLLFKDGDRVCFIGNSITHSGEFHPDIFLYYATRFPKEKVSFFNCGVSGDIAGEILSRMDSDVFVHKPTVAAFMVGMNDMIRGYFGKSKTGETTPNALETYKKSATQIAENLTKYGCKLIIQLPSIYDQTVKNSIGNMFGLNDALGKCAEFLSELAPKYNATVVDYWTIMKNINEQEQKKDTSFTIVSEDRVHPDSPGHLVMAYQFLKTTGAPKYVSKVVIDVKAKKVIESLNCETKLELSQKNIIQFECLENALPYPVNHDALPALNFVPFTEDLNQEILQVNNLDTSQYNLFIDEINVGVYTSSDLAKGINLSMDTLTSQYKQALEVMKYCNEYRKVYNDLRSLAFMEYRTLKEYKGKDDSIAKRVFLNEELEKIKGEGYYEYVKNKCDEYFVIKPNQQQLIAQLNQIRDNIYTANIPRKHIFKIVPKE